MNIYTNAEAFRKRKRKRVIETKICVTCNQLFERPPGKSNAVWEKQENCGKDCACIAIRKEKPVKGTKRRKELVPGERRYKGWGN